MAKRLIPALNGILVEKIVPSSKTTAGILLPVKTAKALHTSFRGNLQPMWGLTLQPPFRGNLQPMRGLALHTSFRGNLQPMWGLTLQPPFIGNLQPMRGLALQTPFRGNLQPMRGFALQTPFRDNLQPMLGLEKSTVKTDGLAGAGSFKPMNFVQSVLEGDEQCSQENKDKRNFVHVLLNRKKTFVAVTDATGNKKIGASAGSLEGSKGRSRLSRYAAEATAEHVGRSARKIGLNSVVIKVKGSAYFRKKKKVILSWREGFRGEGVGVKSRILSIYDVTQLPHNGCRLPKKRRV